MLTFTEVTAGSSLVVCVSLSMDFPIGEFLTSETVSFTAITGKVVSVRARSHLLYGEDTVAVRPLN